MAAPIDRKFSSTQDHAAVKQAIANETHTELAEVERIYDQELNELASDARITQYLGVLTSRRVRAKLRQH